MSLRCFRLDFLLQARAEEHVVILLTRSWVAVIFALLGPWRLSLTAKRAFGSMVFVQGKSNIFPDKYSEFLV